MDIRVQCRHCKAWIRAPLGMSSVETFDTLVLHGNSIECPKCRKMTACDKANMRVRWHSDDEQGGFLGVETEP